MGKDPDYLINAEQMMAMLNLLPRRPTAALVIEECRRYLALDRWEKSGKALRFHEQIDPGVMPGTIAHNRRELDTNAFGSNKRTARLINPLSALEPIYSAPEKCKILSIGPRTEMELLHLVGIGFLPENISAIDLISSSTWIETGDMHELPYPDRTFHAVISSWAIAYSSRPQRVMDEMTRVCKSHGLLAVGCSYDPTTDASRVGKHDDAAAINGNNLAEAADLERLVGNRLLKTCFREEPSDRTRGGPVMLIARITHDRA